MTELDPTAPPPPAENAPPPPPADAPVDAAPVAPEDKAAASSSLSAGTAIRYSYGPEEDRTERVGVILEVIDARTDERGEEVPAGAVVAWLTDLSHPIPLDELERYDAGR